MNHLPHLKFLSKKMIKIIIRMVIAQAKIKKLAKIKHILNIIISTSK